MFTTTGQWSDKRSAAAGRVPVRSAHPATARVTGYCAVAATSYMPVLATM